MMRRLILIPAILLPATALAWTHTYKAWTVEDMPLQYWVASDDCEESVPEDYCAQAAQEGYAGWSDAQCAEFSSEYVDEVIPNIGYTRDYLNYITFNDPENDIPEPGTLAATLTLSSGIAFFIDGQSYSHSYDSDIVFNDNVEFGTQDDILGGQCNDSTNMRSVMTHEIGHTLGLDHSCQEDDLCTDPILREATMYWSESPCSANQATINEDDVQSITAIYGPYATFGCSHELDPGDDDTIAMGNIPFTLNCAIFSDYREEIDVASWNFGDGGFSSDIDASHTFTEPGNYTIQVTVHGEREVCGEEGWEYSYRRVGYVRACGIPDAEFTFEHDEGRTYQMLNETNVSVYGCIWNIQWDFFREGEDTPFDSKNAWEPQVTFPDVGNYRVVLNVGGPAGTGGAELNISVTNKIGGAGYGCNAIGGAAPLGGLLFLVFGLSTFAVRRRQTL